MCLSPRLYRRQTGHVRCRSPEIRSQPQCDALHSLFEYVTLASADRPLIAPFPPILSSIANPNQVFIKLGSQLTAEKITDLAIIPVIFIVQTAVSYFCAFVVTRCCRFKKRQSNFVTAMAVCNDLTV